MTTDPVIVDARGHRCPVPSLRLRKALEARPDVEAFVLLATDPMARIDVPYLMGELGGRLVSVEETEDGLALTVARRAVPRD
ncbi:SirA family protein [Brevundimonas sp. LM2]|uniref:sulfurtransferase TusA family protein n=1 Tax=Brevundimonas sp. LM2 TaxID=1938605 RepID=UPI0009839484|nr:sulfurtransferase TusA family protein [Brevundimonas sp. LM2]AQR62108.1 SirA family protein [Brevundimonas sp. LM2]